MTLRLKSLQWWLLFFAPVVASSTIAATPSIAATLAASSAQVDIFNFSKNPKTINVSTSTNTQAIGDAQAFAFASATFQVDYQNLNLTLASNQTDDLALGTGQSDYFGLAASSAEVIGRNFSINAGDVFAFAFNASLDLTTATDSAQNESATADGAITFRILDEQNRLVDSFNLFSNLRTYSSNLLNLTNTDAFTLNTNVNTLFGGLEKSATVRIQGQYARVFDRDVSLTLIERKESRVAVQVPEPQPCDVTSLLVFATAVACMLRLKHNALKVHRCSDLQY